MDDKKILIVAVVLLVGIFLLDKFGVLTGEVVVKRPEVITKMYVSDDENILHKDGLIVYGNNLIYITSETGSDGTGSTLTFYKEIRSGKFGREETVNMDGGCGDQVCRPGVIGKKEFRVPTDWDGRYCVGLQDRGTKQFVLTCFCVNECPIWE